MADAKHRRYESKWDDDPIQPAWTTKQIWLMVLLPIVMAGIAIGLGILSWVSVSR